VSEPQITIPEAAWRNVADDGSVLKTTIWVNGCAMHLEAHEVKRDGDWQYGVGESEFDELHHAFDAQGHLETVTIRGLPPSRPDRTYVLFAVAFG
jgi:hypothetical protein